MTKQQWRDVEDFVEQTINDEIDDSVWYINDAVNDFEKEEKEKTK